MRKGSHFQQKEPIFEYLFRYLRFRKIIPLINRGKNLLDLGCGFNGAFLTSIIKKLNKGLGIDISVGKSKNNKIKLLAGRVDKPLPTIEKFDYVTSLAVIEHLEFPDIHLKQALVHLKHNGQLLLTTPSKSAKPILEFLAFKLGVVSKDEIKDHKRYYSKTELTKLLTNVGFKRVKIEAIQCGFNLLVKAQK